MAKKTTNSKTKSRTKRQKLPLANLGAVQGGLYNSTDDYDPSPTPTTTSTPVPASLKYGGGFCTSSTSNRSQVLIRRRPR